MRRCGTHLWSLPVHLLAAQALPVLADDPQHLLLDAPRGPRLVHRQLHVALPIALGTPRHEVTGGAHDREVLHNLQWRSNRKKRKA